MSAPSTSTVVRVPFTELQGLLQAIFQRHGCSEAVAGVLAHNCASAQRDGAHSHGVFRMPGYVSTLASGWVDGQATPEVRDVAAGYVSVDAAGASPRTMVTVHTKRSRANVTIDTVAQSPAHLPMK